MPIQGVCPIKRGDGVVIDGCCGEQPTKVAADVGRVCPSVPHCPASGSAVLEAEIVGADGSRRLGQERRDGSGAADDGDEVARSAAHIPVGDGLRRGGGEGEGCRLNAVGDGCEGVAARNRQRASAVIGQGAVVGGAAANERLGRSNSHADLAGAGACGGGEACWRGVVEGCRVGGWAD